MSYPGTHSTEEQCYLEAWLGHWPCPLSGSLAGAQSGPHTVDSQFPFSLPRVSGDEGLWYLRRGKPELSAAFGLAVGLEWLPANSSRLLV